MDTSQLGQPLREDAAPLGILILDTRFPRVVGDIGNPASFPFPVLYETLHGISPEIAVREGALSPRVLETCVAAAGRLIARGARGITTSCGFLALYQDALRQRLPVPVATSSLLQVPLIARLLPRGERVGIITAEAQSLTARHLEAAGADPETPVAGLPPGGAFADAVLGDRPSLDEAAIEAEAVAAGRTLLAGHPDVGAFVLECTNLPPYAAALHAATGKPVYDVIDFLVWFQAGLKPRSFYRGEAAEE